MPGHFIEMDRTLRQRAQPFQVLMGQLVARPQRRQTGDRIEFLKIHQPANGLVVVPTDKNLVPAISLSQSLHWDYRHSQPCRRDSRRGHGQAPPPNRPPALLGCCGCRLKEGCAQTLHYSRFRGKTAKATIPPASSQAENKTELRTQGWQMKSENRQMQSVSVFPARSQPDIAPNARSQPEPAAAAQ